MVGWSGKRGVNVLELVVVESVIVNGIVKTLAQ